MDNDYSLLRPFDLDAAKNGEPICFANGESVKLLAHELGHPYLNDRAVIVLHPDGITTHKEDGQRWQDETSSCDLRMAPLCWVEGKPVYKGDKLWHTSGCTVVANHLNAEGSVCQEDQVMGDWIENLTWGATKKQVKLLAYIDGAGYLRWREESFYGVNVRGTRAPSEDKIITLE